MGTFFSKYAFINVSLYGDSFIESSRSVTLLFNSLGWTALVNDDMVDSMLFCCNLSTGLLCMLVGYLYSQGVGLDGTSTTMLSCFSFFGGMMISMVVSKVMSSAVATVIVCFADDHNALETTHPDEYRALSDAWIDCNCHPAVSKQGILDVESPMVIDPTFPRSYVANRGTYKPPKGYAGLPVSDNGLEYEKEKEATLSKFTQRSNLAGLQRDEDDEETVTF